MGSRVRSRVLIKLSGEALGGARGLDPAALEKFSEQIKRAHELGVEIAVVIGGGNILRGADLKDFDRVVADQMGMLATVLNGLALRENLEQKGVPAVLQSAVTVAYTEPLDPKRARQALREGKIVIFTGGTGSPFVTTDTAAAIRASEIGAHLLLKATNVPGVYSDDPKKNPKAKLYKELTLDEAIEKNLQVMDLAALAICRENRIAIRVFDVFAGKNLERILRGEPVGTAVRPG